MDCCCCDLACGLARPCAARGGRGGGARIRRLGLARRRLGARLLGAGSVVGRPWRRAELGGSAGVVCAARKAGVLGRRASACPTLRHIGRCATPGSHPINAGLPDRASGLVGGFGFVGSDGLAELGAGLVSAFPLVFGASEGFAGRLAAGRAEGWAGAHARVVACRPQAGGLAPGSYRIHRDGLVLWRPGHRPSPVSSAEAGAGDPIGIVVPGAPLSSGRIAVAKRRSAPARARQLTS